MADFSKLKKTKLDSAEYTFWNIEGEPVLIVRPAAESNKPYFNEVLRRADQLAKRKLKVTVELIKDNRDRDRDLYPKFVVIGWRNVNDANGTPVAFSREDCEAFLRAIDDDEFDALREFCRDGASFRDLADGAGTAGNLPTA